MQNSLHDILHKALLVIDLQNDYFPGGGFPLWNAEAALANVERITHTAISRAAEKYTVTILPDCCTTVNEVLHMIALHGVSTRVALVPAKDAI